MSCARLAVERGLRGAGSAPPGPSTRAAHLLAGLLHGFAVATFVAFRRAPRHARAARSSDEHRRQRRARRAVLSDEPAGHAIGRQRRLDVRASKVDRTESHALRRSGVDGRRVRRQRTRRRPADCAPRCRRSPEKMASRRIMRSGSSSARAAPRIHGEPATRCRVVRTRASRGTRSITSSMRRAHSTDGRRDPTARSRDGAARSWPSAAVRASPASVSTRRGADQPDGFRRRVSGRRAAGRATPILSPVAIAGSKPGFAAASSLASSSMSSRRSAGGSSPAARRGPCVEPREPRQQIIATHTRFPRRIDARPAFERRLDVGEQARAFFSRQAHRASAAEQRENQQ